MAKQVAIHDLQPGMFIVGVIKQNGPVKIRKSGLVTSNEMVQGLAEMGVLSVAIDTEKTVEIEVDDAVHVSQTQFVMQANKEKASQDTDTHLSEQFNRSLFMPSLQKVPSAWQYYGTKAAVAVLVTVLGLTSGWFASQAPQLIKGDAAQVALDPESTISASDASAGKGSNTASSDASGANDVALDQSGAMQSEAVDANMPADNAAAVSSAANATNALSAPANPSQTALNSDNSPQIEANGSDTESNEVATSNGLNNAENQVSAELLQRFEQAMADLEKESSVDAEFADDGETLEYGDQNNDFNSTDVQRVDQLPARVMARLPKMSFSAHMYASYPRDRWVKVNGVEMGEGEWLNDKVFIERIEPQHVILIFEDHQFSMRALSEW